MVYREYDGDNVASAVCVYKKSDIETVFKGNFQYKNTEGAWVPLPEELKPDPRLDNVRILWSFMSKFITYFWT